MRRPLQRSRVRWWGWSENLWRTSVTWTSEIGVIAAAPRCTGASTRFSGCSPVAVTRGLVRVGWPLGGVNAGCRSPPGSSVPAAPVAGRALPVPSGWASGPPVPRLVQSDGSRLREATQTYGRALPHEHALAITTGPVSVWTFAAPLSYARPDGGRRGVSPKDPAATATTALDERWGVAAGPVVGSWSTGWKTQNCFRLHECLRLSLDTAPDLTLRRLPMWRSVDFSWMSCRLTADQDPQPIGQLSGSGGAAYHPISVPAALVAGRALRVPTGSAFGRPFPRPAAAGPRRVVGSGHE